MIIYLIRNILYCDSRSYELFVTQMQVLYCIHRYFYGMEETVSNDSSPPFEFFQDKLGLINV